MKSRALLIATALSLALLTAVALSQEAEKELAPKPDVKALIDQLGSPDFARRKAAEDEIMKLGELTLPALKEAAKEHADAHVRYEAERLMHRLALAKSPSQERELADRPDPARPELGSIAEAERQMNELLRQLEERGMMDWDAFEKWREHMRNRFGQPAPGGVRGGVISGVSDNGQERIEYEQRSDGSLKIRITSRDGRAEEYEARSMDDLKETHPEVHAKVSPLFGNVRIEWGDMPDPFFRRLSPGSRGLTGREPTSPSPLGPQETFRMGVWTGEVSEPLRVHLKLPRGVGVLVEDVVPGSFAAEIGLEPFDVIRTVQGEKVGSAADIRRVISTVAAGEQVVLDIIRKGEPLKLMRNR